MDAVTKLDDLRVPPGNRLHALDGEYYAIRVNEQYRLIFRFEGRDAWHVLCTGYHRGERMTLPTHRAPTHPGEMLLKEFLEPMDVTQSESARRLGVSFQRLNAVVRGRRAVSADTALRLEKFTGWDAQIWMSLQAKWDLWHARRHPLPKVRPLAAVKSAQD